MKINKDNYEAYFLDYHEGNLTPSEVEEMLVFIELNPELLSEFEEYEPVSIIPDNKVRFQDKESLKKSGPGTGRQISAENIEEFLLSETEGILREEELQQLNSFILANPRFEKDRKLFKLAHLKADETLRFSRKESLKHKAIPTGNINETNYENFLIQEVEGTLSADDLLELAEFLRLNPHLANDRKLFGLTRLRPDSSITFAGKASLKHSIVPLRRIVYYALSAAATLLILFGIYFSRQNESRTIELAGNQSSGLSKTHIAAPVHIPPPAVPVKTNNTLAIQNPAIALKSAGGNPYNSHSSEKMAVRPAERSSVAVSLLTSLAYNPIVSRDFVEPEFMFIRTSQMRSNEYLELFYNIKLAEQMQYAQINAQDQNPEKTILNTLSSKVTGLFASNQRTVTETRKEATIWTFAELGVKTYNSITRDDVKLDLQKDEQGKVVSYSLIGDRVDMQRDLNK